MAGCVERKNKKPQNTELTGREVYGYQRWEVGEGNQKVQTSSYKTEKSWACNVRHGNCN